MKKSGVSIVNAASGFRHAALDWQRVSKVVLNFLKRIDLDEDNYEEVFVTPPESPRDLSSIDDLEPNFNSNSKPSFV